MIRTPILMYHSVCATPGRGAMAPFVLDPRLLASHLDVLAERRCHTAAELAAGADPDGTGVCLTFDDAYADFHDQVLPLLVERGVRATLYVPTAFVDGRARFLEPGPDADRAVLTRTQLAEVAASGLVEIGAHSHTHPQLDRVDRMRARAEARLPRSILEQELGVAVSTFAYPYGYHDRTVRAAVADAGYALAVAVANRRAHDDDPFAVPRLTVEAGTDEGGLADLLSRPWSHAARRWSEAKRVVARGIRHGGRAAGAPHPLDVPPTPLAAPGATP